MKTLNDTLNEIKRRNTMFWIVMIIVLVIAVSITVVLLFDGPGRREIAELRFSPIDFNNLHDGMYVGNFKGEKSHLRDTQVEIVVSEGIVSDTKIIKGAIDKNGEPMVLKGNRSVLQILDAVAQAKTLEVDVISGATITSKSHLKAMENALVQAQNK